MFAQGIGRTFQLTRIFPRLTVMENMLVAAQHSGPGRRRVRNPLARAGGSADRRRALELLEFTGIADHAGALAETLSYGQRKLLELAYVLVADPAVVLLDEPAGGVNPSLINHISARIRELNAARDDLSHRGAQHGLRDEPVRPHRRPGLRHRRRRRAHRRSSGRTRGCSTPTSGPRRRSDE